MQRTNRWLLRLWFFVILLMALAGWWIFLQSWQTFTATLSVPSTSDTDWVALISQFAEDAIKFFQGASSATP